MTEWVTLKDIPAMTGLEQSTVYQYRGSGRLPPHDGKVGDKPVWKWSTIRDWNDTRNRRNNGL